MQRASGGLMGIDPRIRIFIAIAILAICVWALFYLSSAITPPE
jgi:hypothetical protein